MRMMHSINVDNPLLLTLYFINETCLGVLDVWCREIAPYSKSLFVESETYRAFYQDLHDKLTSRNSTTISALEKDTYLQNAKKLIDALRTLIKSSSRFRHARSKKVAQILLIGLKKFSEIVDIATNERALKPKTLDEIKSIQVRFEQVCEEWVRFIVLRKNETFSCLPKHEVDLLKWLKENLDETSFEHVQTIISKTVNYLSNEDFYGLNLFFKPNKGIDVSLYKPLIHYLALFDPDSALNHFISYLKETNKKEKEDRNAHRELMGRYHREILRMLFIIESHERWKKKLLDVEGLVSAEAVQEFISTNKREFYRNTFLQQEITNLRESAKALFTAGSTRESVYHSVLQRKRQITDEISLSEARLQAKFSTYQNIKAMMVQAVTMHVAYQQVQVCAAILDKEAEPRSDTTLEENAQEQELKIIAKQCAGYACIVFDFFIDYWLQLDFYYSLIQLVNNLLFAQINLLFKLGSLLDTVLRNVSFIIHYFCPTNAQPILSYHTELARTDELAIIQNEAALQWASGLLINCLLVMINSGQTAVIPATIAYSCATLCMKMLDLFMFRLQLEDRQKFILKLGANLTVYRIIYFQAMVYSSNLFAPNPQQEFTEEQAFTLLGLSKNSSASDIRKKYLSLALKNHPDKCRQNHSECSISIVNLNKAYKVLRPGK